MLNQTETDNINAFVEMVCKAVEGIGKATAGHIASDFDADLTSFLQADHDRLAATLQRHDAPRGATRSYLRKIRTHDECSIVVQRRAGARPGL